MTLKMKIDNEYQSQEAMKDCMNLVYASLNETQREEFKNGLKTVLGDDGELTVDIRSNDDGSLDVYTIIHRVIPADAGTET